MSCVVYCVTVDDPRKREKEKERASERESLELTRVPG
jgi:hypothetical protein